MRTRINPLALTMFFRVKFSKFVSSIHLEQPHSFLLRLFFRPRRIVQSSSIRTDDSNPQTRLGRSILVNLSQLTSPFRKQPQPILANSIEHHSTPLRWLFYANFFHGQWPCSSRACSSTRERLRITTIDLTFNPF